MLRINTRVPSSFPRRGFFIKYFYLALVVILGKIHMAGRPLKFETVEILQSQIDYYFEVTPIDIQTITGLALHLDTSRETLMNYEENPIFFDTIKKAKAKIEHAYEMRGLKVGGSFDIFRLKNMGWKDKYENELSGGIAIKKPSWFDEK